MVLSIVLSAVAIAVVLTFATITQMHIDRKRLLALTDSAAIHAASALDEDRYFSEAGATVYLTDHTVRAAAAEFLTRVPPGQRARLHGVQVSSPTGALGDSTAQVTMAAQIRPGYIPWAVLPVQGISVEVTSAARAD